MACDKIAIRQIREHAPCRAEEGNVLVDAAYGVGHLQPGCWCYLSWHLENMVAGSCSKSKMSTALKEE